MKEGLQPVGSGFCMFYLLLFIVREVRLLYRAKIGIDSHIPSIIARTGINPSI